MGPGKRRDKGGLRQGRRCGRRKLVLLLTSPCLQGPTPPCRFAVIVIIIAPRLQKSCVWFVVVAHGIRSLESFGDSAIVINQNPHRHRNDVRRTEARPHPACQSASGDVMRPGVAGGGRAKGLCLSGVCLAFLRYY